MASWWATIATFTIFVCAFVGTAALGSLLRSRMRIERRLRDSRHPTEVVAPTSAWAAWITRYFGDDQGEAGLTVRAGLQRDMLKAGFFGPHSASYFQFFRAVSVVAFTSVAFVLVITAFKHSAFVFQLAVLAVASGGGFAAPGLYLSWRQRWLITRYRLFFPDFLDLLMVCVDAGLSVEAALERVAGEIGDRNREFAVNLNWLLAEARAGRGTIDALENFASRLSLEEARSLVLALRQSLTLGSSVAGALTVFSQDMRERRLLRAETEANKLPVKIMVPLGLLIFPVILLVMILPALVRIMPMFAALNHG